MDASELGVLLKPLPWFSCHVSFLGFSILGLFGCGGLFGCLIAWQSSAWLTDGTAHVVVCVALIIRLPLLLSIVTFFVFFTLSGCCFCLIKRRLWAIPSLNHCLFARFQTYGVLGWGRIILNARYTCFSRQAWIRSKGLVTGRLLSGASWPCLFHFTDLAALVARE